MDRALRRRLRARAKERKNRKRDRIWFRRQEARCDWCISNRTVQDQRARHQAGARLQEYVADPDTSVPDPVPFTDYIAWHEDNH